jgi:hypothetical protein
MDEVQKRSCTHYYAQSETSTLISMSDLCDSIAYILLVTYE